MGRIGGQWLLCLSLMMGVYVAVSAQGIRWEQGSYDEARAAAAAREQLLFVFVCADWLEVCPILRDEVMPLPEVGAAFNDRFTAWQFDAANVAEHPYLDSIRILNVPEYIFIDVQGRVQYRASGFKDSDELQALAVAAADPENHLERLRKDFLVGKLNRAEMARFIVEVDAQGWNMEQVANAYLQGLPIAELTQGRNFHIASLGASGIDDPVFRHVLARRDAYRDTLGADRVDNFLRQTTQKTISMAVEQQDAARLDSCMAVWMRILPPDEAAVTVQLNRMHFATAGNDWKAYAAHARNLMELHVPIPAEIVNDAAWELYQHTKDPELLAEARTLARASIHKQPAYWNWHTLGAVELKLGNKADAMTAAQNARRYAKAGTPEMDEVQALIQAIQK